MKAFVVFYDGYNGEMVTGVTKGRDEIDVALRLVQKNSNLTGRDIYVIPEGHVEMVIVEEEINHIPRKEEPVMRDLDYDAGEDDE